MRVHLAMKAYQPCNTAHGRPEHARSHLPDRWLVEAALHVEPASRRRRRGGPPLVVEAGAEAKASSARVQKIKLTLELHMAGRPA